VVVFRRPIKFEDVDAASIVFFARFLAYAHEAMEAFFDALEGGYARLIVERRVGLPAVHVDMSFASPARYGDALSIETTTARLGGRSAVLRYRMKNEATGALVAEVRHTVVTTDLTTLRSCEMPDDVRGAFAAHLEPAPAS
jgi:4-hydroxybenzoyl-CoA thioesterase